MKERGLEIPMNLRKVHALQDLRYAERVSIDCRLTYSVEGEPMEEGLLQDLLKTGCHVHSLQPPPAGNYGGDSRHSRCKEASQAETINVQLFIEGLLLISQR